MIETLRSSGLDTQGLEKYPGFIESARFMDYMQSFDQRVYNFSDDGVASNISNPLLYWFAAEANDMSLLWNDRIITSSSKRLHIYSRRLLPLAMIFMTRCDLEKVAPSQNRCWSGLGEQPIFICRDEKFYLGAKGGSPSLPHAHMDAGSFVYEWGGVRWAMELGSQSYHPLEAAGVAQFENYTVFEVDCSYSDYQKISFELERLDAIIDGTDFADSVKLTFALKEQFADEIARRVIEISSGKTEAKRLGERFDAK
jgi:hypothetical protein